MHDTKAFAVFDSGRGPEVYASGTGQGRVYRHTGAFWWTGAGQLTGGSGVSSMVVFDDGAGAELYAAGNFTHAEGTPARFVAKYNGQRWAAVGNGVSNPGPNAKLVVHNGVLYANGSRWTGTAWAPIGRGSIQYPLQVLDLGRGEELVSISTTGTERWTGTAWARLDDGLGVGAVLFGAASFEQEGQCTVWVGGNFTSCGGQTIPNIALWTPPVSADMNGDAGATVEDLLAYLDAFESGAALADFDDGRGRGARDGGVTVEDLLFYLARFETGC